MNVNLYKTVRDNHALSAIDIFDVYEIVRTDVPLSKATAYIQNRHKQGLQSGFQGYEKKEYQRDKSLYLPCCVFAGLYDRKKPADKQPDVIHSGRMNIDIDLNTFDELDAFFNLIGDGQIPFIEACARSVSGIYTGSMWANVIIDIPVDFEKVPAYLVGKLKINEKNYKSKLHTAYFDMFADMLMSFAGIKSGSTKDVKRLRYLSFDPEIYVNKHAQSLTLHNLEMHLKQQNKSFNKELTTEFNGMSDPFKIAMSFAKRKAGECVPGNYHNFLVQLACCLNRMGISEKGCIVFVTDTLNIELTTNCISFPYRAYSSEFGAWKDWQANQAPSLSAPSITTTEGTQAGQNTDYFKALGFSKDESGSNRYYFYAYMSYTIVALTPGKMTKANLLQLAPLNWWAAYFPKGESFHLEGAINYLITYCTDAGFFSSLRLRGRGAWIDKDRVVIHTGRQLIINGTRHRLGSVETEFIYEMAEELSLSPDNPMTAEQGQEFYNILKKLNWKRKLDSVLMMGWLGLLPICGALQWRPHIWIVGAAGSGKTWVGKNVCNKFISRCGYKFEGGSTESGIRELYGNDALGGIFDEAEGENEREQLKIENILKFSRSASASDSAIVKGTGNGARVYYPRQIFAFISIVPQTEHGADKRRVSILRLGEPIKEDLFRPIEEEFKNLVTDEFARAFQARMLSMVPKVLENIKVFKKAVSKATGRSDMGDQLGSMIAAWWSLMSDDVISIDDANELCAKFDFTTEQSMEAMLDEVRCLYAILNAQIRTDSGAFRSISELIDMIVNGTSNDNLDDTDKLLKRHGIRVETVENCIYVSVFSGSYIKKIMHGTNWAKDWRTPLERIKGASYCKGKKFLGKTEAVVKIPFGSFMESESDAIEPDVNFPF